MEVNLVYEAGFANRTEEAKLARNLLPSSAAHLQERA